MALVALAFGAGSATAQDAPVDSLARDTLAVAAPDTSAVPDTVIVRNGQRQGGVVTVGRDRRPAAREADGPFSAPGWVMLRSAIVPGWGQWHNRQWVKALAVAGVEGWMAYRIYDDNRTLDDLQLQVDAARAAGDQDLANALALQYNDRLDTMVARQWLLAGVIAYALLDAYVDAHFRGFDVEFDSDPALEDGKPSSLGVRAGLRWTF